MTFPSSSKFNDFFKFSRFPDRVAALYKSLQTPPTGSKSQKSVTPFQDNFYLLEVPLKMFSHKKKISKHLTINSILRNENNIDIILEDIRPNSKTKWSIIFQIIRKQSLNYVLRSVFYFVRTEIGGKIVTLYCRFQFPQHST